MSRFPRFFTHRALLLARREAVSDNNDLSIHGLGSLKDITYRSSILFPFLEWLPAVHGNNRF